MLYQVLQFTTSFEFRIGILITILACFIIIFICRWSDYLLPQFVCKKFKQFSGETKVCTPQISIVIPSLNQTQELAEHIEELLNQDYPNYEVIIVEESKNEETKDLIKSLTEKYKHLRHTFTPQSSKNICKRKLSITLGVRAARGEWVVVTTPDCHPLSNQWLTTLSRSFTKETSVVCGYANYDESSPNRVMYSRLRNSLMGLKASLLNLAFAGDICNFSFRKADFIQIGGFANSLHVTCGEAEMLVAALSQKGHIKFCCDKLGAVIEKYPGDVVQTMSDIVRRETLRHCGFYSMLFLFREGLATSMLYISYILIILGWCIFTMKWIHLGMYDYHDIYIDIMLLYLTIQHFICPIILLNKCTAYMGEKQIGVFAVYWDIVLPFRNLYLKIKRWQLRNDFKLN